MLNLIAQETTKIAIPEPFTNAIYQLSMWLCIAAVIVPIIMLLLLIAKSKIENYLESFLGKKKSEPEQFSDTDGGVENYKRKSCILTQSENDFYIKLCVALKQAGLDVIVWPQVNVSSIIESVGRDSQERMKAFNRICRKSIDYVIVNKKTRETILCIELDDYTHKWNRRQERDNFINSIFDSVGIPLFRIKTERNYDFYEIISAVKRILQSRQVERTI